MSHSVLNFSFFLHQRFHTQTFTAIKMKHQT